MTTVDQVAPLEPAVAAQPAGAPFDPTAAGAMPVASRLIGAIAIGVALLSAALAATRGNQIRAADLLGVNRNTLRKKIRDLEIQVYRSSGG